MTTALSRIAIALVLVAGLGGCSLIPSGSPASPSPSGPPLAQTSASDVDDRCDGLVTPADSQTLWTGELEPIGYSSYGAGTTETMSGTALVQSEALICSWSDTSGAPAILMIAMADGKDGFDRTKAIFGSSNSPYNSVRILDGAFVACRGDDSVSCHWNVLNGTTWISVLLAGLTTEQVFHGNQLMPEPADLVSALAASVEKVDLPPTPAPTSFVNNCTSYLNPPRLSEAMDAPADRISVIPQPALEDSSIDERSPVFGQMMWKYAAEILGYSTCGIQIDGNLVAVATRAPGASWVLRDADAEQPELAPVTGHGTGISDCTGDGQGRSCTVAFGFGADLLFIQLAASRPDATTIGLKVLTILTYS